MFYVDYANWRIVWLIQSKEILRKRFDLCIVFVLGNLYEKSVYLVLLNAHDHITCSFLRFSFVKHKVFAQIESR